MTRNRSTRLTVEECAFLDIREFTRGGVLDVGLGSVHELNWVGPDTETWRKMFFWVEKVGVDCEKLNFRYSAPNGGFGAENVIQYAVEVISEPCRFGGIRRWFRCPLLRGPIACQSKARQLFLPPGARYLGCRSCYDLTYRSAQEHDQRVDELSLRTWPELRALLGLPISRRTFLVHKAIQKKRERFLRDLKLSWSKFSTT